MRPRALCREHGLKLLFFRGWRANGRNFCGRWRLDVKEKVASIPPRKSADLWKKFEYSICRGGSACHPDFPQSWKTGFWGAAAAADWNELFPRFWKKGSHPDSSLADGRAGPPRGGQASERGSGHFFKSFPLLPSIQSSCCCCCCSGNAGIMQISQFSPLLQIE